VGERGERATLRKRIAGAGTALVLAVTFGVMAATGIALAGGNASTKTTTTTIQAESQTPIMPLPTWSRAVTFAGSNGPDAAAAL
jgi:hypothetical protein